MREVSKHKGTEYITLLSVISAISVVIIHVNGCFWTYSRESYWASANLFESVCYFAVPVFFMISGATLMDYRDRYPDKIYVKKRIWRTLIPYIVWCSFWLAANSFMSAKSFKELSLSYFLRGLFNGDADAYWFFPALFCVYVFIPVFSLVPKEKRKTLFSVYIILYFLFDSLLPFISNILEIEPLNTGISFKIGSGYMVYALIGYLLKEYTMPPPMAEIMLCSRSRWPCRPPGRNVYSIYRSRSYYPDIQGVFERTVHFLLCRGLCFL